MFFRKKKVYSQGSELQLNTAVKESDIGTFDALDSASISLLIADEKPSIDVPIDETLECNVQRTLECRKQGKGGIANESDLISSLRGDSLEKLQGSSSYRKEH